MTFGLNNIVQISFEGALKEVYELNMFPLRQHEMKVALEHEDHMMWMETEVGCFCL
jgi:hypothetical protein